MRKNMNTIYSVCCKFLSNTYKNCIKSQLGLFHSFAMNHDMKDECIKQNVTIIVEIFTENKEILVVLVSFIMTIYFS